MDEANDAAATGLALHQRLLSGELVVTEEIAELYLEPLSRRLSRASAAYLDPQIVEQAAIDALLDYLQHPQRYQPERVPLDAYLLMAAKRDLKNALRSERRHTARAIPLDGSAPAVELALAARNESVEEVVMENVDLELPAGLDRARALDLVLAAFSDPIERRLLRLYLDGERRTAAYAAVLGIGDRPAGEQRQTVKRVKDRFEKRLTRLRARAGGPAEEQR